MIRNLGLYLSEAFDNLVKNKLMALASSITVASCVFILIISFCVSINIKYTLNQFNNSIGISAMISDDLETDQINYLYDSISELDYVYEVKFISKDEALKDFERTLGMTESKKILEGFEKDNPLPRSFDIKLKDSNFYSQAISDLEKLQSNGIDNVRHAKHEVDVLLITKKVIYIISLIIMISLALNSIIIIMNTIKLAVHNRKDEICIMKYIGATNWFICWPFIIEGAVIGIVGSVVPIIISWLCYEKFIEIILECFPEITKLLSFESNNVIFYKVSPYALCLGIGIGVFGSMISLRKHLYV
jgi:cell division transport system permease protein